MLVQSEKEVCIFSDSSVPYLNNEYYYSTFSHFFLVILFWHLAFVTAKHTDAPVSLNLPGWGGAHFSTRLSLRTLPSKWCCYIALAHGEALRLCTVWCRAAPNVSGTPARVHSPYSIDQIGMFINCCVLYLALCQTPQSRYGILPVRPSTTLVPVVITPLQHMLQHVYQSHDAARPSEGSTLRTLHAF